MIIENWNRQEKSVIIIEKNGQVESDRVIKDNEEVIIKDKGKKLTAQQIHFLNQSNEFKKHCDSLGGYIHMIYAKNEILFNDIDIDKANISRIIYLATYMDYNDRKEGLLCVRSQHNKLEPMDKKTMQNVLKLTDSTFKRFLKDMKGNELIYEVDKKFYVNPIYFNKGDIDKDVKKSVDKSYCRLFIKPIRDLYEGCKTSKHKVLASIYQLIPYIHYEHNIVCHNPNEATDYPKAITLRELCEMLEVDYKNSSKLAKSLYEFKVNIEGIDYNLFTYVILNAQYDYFVVNPLVIYGGNNYDNMVRTSKALFFNKYTHRQKRK